LDDIMTLQIVGKSPAGKKAAAGTLEDDKTSMKSSPERGFRRQATVRNGS
jgi:hypothetical protein